MKKIFLLFCLLFLTLPAQAQHDIVPAVSTEKIQAVPVYEHPTLKNLSKLYWSLSLLDLSNDTQIDNYLVINECDVYRDYFNNEFEWKNIRQSARDLIQKDVKNFPTHFKFVQPLKLGNYNLKTETFDVLNDYKIQPTTRFELLSEDAGSIICEQENGGSPIDLAGYPRSMIMEFSRPFSLDHVTVPSAIAQAYIEEKMIPFNLLKPQLQTPDRLYDLRDAYIVFNVKIIAPKTMEFATDHGRQVAQLLGVLESVQIYADPEQTLLLHEEIFKR